MAAFDISPLHTPFKRNEDIEDANSRILDNQESFVINSNNNAFIMDDPYFPYNNNSNNNDMFEEDEYLSRDVYTVNDNDNLNSNHDANDNSRDADWSSPVSQRKVCFHEPSLHESCQSAASEEDSLLNGYTFTQIEDINKMSSWRTVATQTTPCPSRKGEPDYVDFVVPLVTVTINTTETGEITFVPTSPEYSANPPIAVLSSSRTEPAVGWCGRMETSGSQNFYPEISRRESEPCINLAREDDFCELSVNQADQRSHALLSRSNTHLNFCAGSCGRGSNADLRGSNFDRRGSNFGWRGSNFDRRGSNFNRRGSNFGWRGSNYESCWGGSDQSLDVPPGCGLGVARGDVRRVSDISCINELKNEVPGFSHLSSEYYEVVNVDPDTISLDSIHARVFGKCANTYEQPKKCPRRTRGFIVTTLLISAVGITACVWFQNFGS